MILKPDVFDAGNQLYFRRVSESSLVEIGVYPVLYGYRIRAGFAGSLCCVLDWCAGSDWSAVENLYSIAVWILSQREESRECFAGIPTVSRIKPFFRDAEFLTDIAKLTTGVVEPIKLDQSLIERRTVEHVHDIADVSPDR